MFSVSAPSVPCPGPLSSHQSSVACDVTFIESVSSLLSCPIETLSFWFTLITFTAPLCKPTVCSSPKTWSGQDYDTSTLTLIPVPLILVYPKHEPSCFLCAKNQQAQVWMSAFSVSLLLPFVCKQHHTCRQKCPLPWLQVSLQWWREDAPGLSSE